MDTKNSVVIAGVGAGEGKGVEMEEGIRVINGNGKNTIKNVLRLPNLVGHG